MQIFRTCAFVVSCLLASVGSVHSSDIDALVAVGDTRAITRFELVGDVQGSGEWDLDSPQSIAIDHRGDVLIADSGNNRVLVVSMEGAVVREFGGYGWDEGQFDTPTDLAVYPGFYVYVLDEGNRRVERFDERGALAGVEACECAVGVAHGFERVYRLAVNFEDDVAAAQAAVMRVSGTTDAEYVYASRGEVCHAGGTGLVDLLD